MVLSQLKQYLDNLRKGEDTPELVSEEASPAVRPPSSFSKRSSLRIKDIEKNKSPLETVFTIPTTDVPPPIKRSRVKETSSGGIIFRPSWEVLEASSLLRERNVALSRSFLEGLVPPADNAYISTLTCVDAQDRLSSSLTEVVLLVSHLLELPRLPLVESLQQQISVLVKQVATLSKDTPRLLSHLKKLDLEVQKLTKDKDVAVRKACKQAIREFPETDKGKPLIEECIQQAKQEILVSSEFRLNHGMKQRVLIWLPL